MQTENNRRPRGDKAAIIQNFEENHDHVNDISKFISVQRITRNLSRISIVAFRTGIARETISGNGLQSETLNAGAEFSLSLLG